MALAMQGSSISNLDVGSATMKLGDEGFYNLMIGAADMGTGCDTILAQMAAECMDCPVDEIEVFGADTDSSPYDSGSYASSTTYLTGKAVEMACEELKTNMCKIAAEMMGCSPEETEFTGDGVRRLDGSGFVSRFDIATKSMLNNSISAQTTASHSSTVSPPPYMVGMVEIELDKETGKVEILDYVAVVDCGTPINPNLARIQAEGGIVQGIGMALSENVTYGPKGNILENCGLWKGGKKMASSRRCVYRWYSNSKSYMDTVSPSWMPRSSSCWNRPDSRRVRSKYIRLS